MASHITTPAMNSQSLHKLNALDSMQSVRSNSSRKGKRSSIEHIQESLKIVRKKAVNARKNTAVIPWIVPSRYRVVKPEEDFDHTYNLCFASRFFVTFEEANSSKVSYIINILIMLVLVVSCVQYVVVTLPSVQIQPNSCPDPACDNDPVLCPGRMVCEPAAPEWVNTLEMACVMVFSIDYVVRVLTCAHTPARICGVIPLSLSLSEAEPGDPEWDILERYSDPDFEELWWVTIYRYVLQPLNIIDLIAIIPFYIELLADSGSSLSIIRILRLARVIRLVKSGKGRFTKGLRILTNTLVTSAPMNAFLLAIALVIFVVCGAVGYLIEGGDFRVTEEYPEGVYMRPNLLGTHLEPSPFLSVLHGMYWSIVTSTTVGYGDIYATTWGGRVFACACTFLGIVVIALPVTVLGNHFGKEYEKEYMKAESENGRDYDPGPYSPSRRNSFEEQVKRSSFGNNNNSNSNSNYEMVMASAMSPPASPLVLRSMVRARSLSNTSGPAPGGRFPGIATKVTAGLGDGRAGAEAADVERAAESVRRLEEMACELQAVIRGMREELEGHRAVLSRGAAAPARRDGGERAEVQGCSVNGSSVDVGNGVTIKEDTSEQITL